MKIGNFPVRFTSDTPSYNMACMQDSDRIRLSMRIAYIEMAKSFNDSIPEGSEKLPFIPLTKEELALLDILNKENK